MVVGASLAFWLGSSDWHGQIDDVFISIAYGWRWVDGHGLTWNTGERIEAYSNPLLVMVLALGALAGLDLGLLAKLIAAASGIAVLGMAAWWSPRDVRAIAVTLAIAIWAPFAYWSTQGMETMLFAALGSLGWAAVCRGRTDLAVPVLVLAALTRPEGHAWLVAALAVRAASGSHGVERRDASAVISLMALVAYHIVRVAWFGALLPGSYHVKIEDTPLALGFTHAFGDLWRDLVLAGGIAIAVVGSVRPSRATTLAFVPLGIQVVVSARVGGDWMGHARLLVPGVLATALAMLAASEGRPFNRRQVALPLLVVPFGLVWNDVANIRVRQLPALSTVAEAYRRGIDTPLAQDVQFIVEHVPEGGTVLINDVGMPGNVPDVAIIDYRGLAHAGIAALPIDRVDDAERVRRIAELLGEPPQFVRLARWEGEPLPDIERTVGSTYTEHAVLDVPYTNGKARLAWWWRPDARTPDDGVILARWRTLVARFPSQPFLHRQYAIALLRVGDVATAAAALDATRARWPELGRADVDALWFPDAPFDEVPDRGVPMYWNQVITSRPFPVAELSALALQIDVDNPGVDGALVRVGTSTSCGISEIEVTVRSLQTVELPAVGCEGEARIVVAFLNDAMEPADRNAYARLRRR